MPARMSPAPACRGGRVAAEPTIAAPSAAKVSVVVDGLTHRRNLALGVTAAIFVAAGVLHFVKPHTYERIVPPAFPSPSTLVLVSGVAEIAGGVGLLVPRLRRPAGWGLIALLAAVFPANVYMALAPGRFSDVGVPAWAWWARLPLQPALMTWIWAIALPRNRADGASSGHAQRNSATEGGGGGEDSLPRTAPDGAKE